MKCIYCSQETQVVNSRHQKKANQVWRRRKCLGCSSVFTTIEGVEVRTSLVVQHGKTLEPFSRDKLLLSIYDSLKHRKTAHTDATGLTQTILSGLPAMAKDAVLQRQDIIQTALKVLGRFDKVAATHYAAFHSID